MAYPRHTVTHLAVRVTAYVLSGTPPSNADRRTLLRIQALPEMAHYTYGGRQPTPGKAEDLAMRHRHKPAGYGSLLITAKGATPAALHRRIRLWFECGQALVPDA